MKTRSLALAALLLVPAPAALAQAGGWYGGPDGRYARGGHAYDRDYYGGNGRGAVCERICPHDTSPCDPISFKIADGRCNPGLGGGSRR